MDEARRSLRPGVRRAGIAVLAIALAAGTAYGSTFTSLFAADEVRVEGAVNLGAAEIRALAGVEVGANVFHLDVGAAEERLRSDPRIAAATVATDLPDIVTVHVVERLPVATAQVEGVQRVVADDGVLLPGDGAGPLPQIVATEGELAESERVAVAGVLAVLAPSIRRAVTTARVSAAGDVTLQISGGLMVTYGAASDVAAKAEALRAVLAWADRESVNLAAIDVTVPGAPTARTVDGSPASI